MSIVLPAASITIFIVFHVFMIRWRLVVKTFKNSIAERVPINLRYIYRVSPLMETQLNSLKGVDVAWDECQRFEASTTPGVIIFIIFMKFDPVPIYFIYFKFDPVPIYFICCCPLASSKPTLVPNSCDHFSSNTFLLFIASFPHKLIHVIYLFHHLYFVDMFETH